MIQYAPDGTGETYGLSYSELREQYERFVNMSDVEFLGNLSAAAHTACIIGWLKELGADATIGDTGIVHQLIHLMQVPGVVSLKKIRKQFKELLRLA